MKTAIEKYIEKRTLIIGNVNSGKTFETRRILQLFVDAGYAAEIILLDLSPGPVKNIGGKMQLSGIDKVHYLTADIHAPRLTGKSESQIRILAEENVQIIETLFDEVKKYRLPILFVNDASLYLQTGELERFEEMMRCAATQVVNSYYGDHFKDSWLTRREKHAVETLMKTCDQVTRL